MTRLCHSVILSLGFLISSASVFFEIIQNIGPSAEVGGEGVRDGHNGCAMYGKWLSMENCFKI